MSTVLFSKGMAAQCRAEQWQSEAMRRRAKALQGDTSYSKDKAGCRMAKQRQGRAAPLCAGQSKGWTGRGIAEPRQAGHSKGKANGKSQ